MMEIVANEIRNLAHELRTPLTSILGFAELLLEDKSITGKQREYLEIILDESVKMSEMISVRVNEKNPVATAPGSDLSTEVMPER